MYSEKNLGTIESGSSIYHVIICKFSGLPLASWTGNTENKDFIKKQQLVPGYIIGFDIYYSGNK